MSKNAYTTTLTAFWQVWLRTERLPQLSADDLLHFNMSKRSTINLTETQHAVAQNFYNLWEAAINDSI